MQVRRANMKDMMEMQQCNLRCLPENYNLRYYYYHYLSWPQELYVLEDVNNRIAGYVLAKLDDEDDAKKKHGHITSLAVLRSHRKLGAASALMRASMQEMREVDDAHFCSLHVRKTNAAALHLYQDTLRFRCVDVEEKYYVDDEDAFHMKRYFKAPGVSEDNKAGKQVKIAYITPHGDFKWTNLDADQLKYLNADIPNYNPNISGAAAAAAAEGNAKQPAAAKKNETTTTGSSGAVASSAEEKKKENNNNSTNANKGGNNNKKKGGNNNNNEVDIEAQLAALGEGGKKKDAAAGGNNKKDEGNNNKKKGKK